MVVNCLVEEYLHLLLQEGVELGFELLLMLLGWKAIVVNLLIIFLYSKAENGLLEFLSEVLILNGGIKLD